MRGSWCLVRESRVSSSAALPARSGLSTPNRANTALVCSKSQRNVSVSALLVDPVLSPTTGRRSHVTTHILRFSTWDEHRAADDNATMRRTRALCLSRIQRMESRRARTPPSPHKNLKLESARSHDQRTTWQDSGCPYRCVGPHHVPSCAVCTPSPPANDALEPQLVDAPALDARCALLQVGGRCVHADVITRLLGHRSPASVPRTRCLDTGGCMRSLSLVRPIAMSTPVDTKRDVRNVLSCVVSNM
ncbi:hypothetical protein K438DRAFT_1802197 [Mycena galopus ATCC 62051]|nr:hypothetical protein K438DRAFT_1802197 [Mycena galopus ATCC 62051]